MKSLLPSRLYRGAEYLVAEMPIDPRVAERWLPRSLRLASDVADLFTASFSDNAFGSVYLEAGVFLRVRHWGRTAIHCPWMVVDDDVALILGRELLGYPKKLARLEWDRDGDVLRTRCRRRGSQLLSMHATLGEVVASPPPFLGRPHRNLVGTILPRVVAFTPREAPIEVRDAEIRVEVHGSERDPLHELGFGSVVRGRLHRVDVMRGLPPFPVGIAAQVNAFRRRHL